MIAGPDPADPFSQARPLGEIGAMPSALRLGVPLSGQRVFFGDRVAAAAYEEAIARMARLGASIVEIDIEPFYETARLLYEGPWVAERYITARSLIASAHEAMHPVTRGIILDGARPTAVDAFAAFYKLKELRRVRDHVFRQIDALAAADDTDRLYGRTGAGQSGRAQQPARHLHQFRQPARSLRSCAAGCNARRTARHPA